MLDMDGEESKTTIDSAVLLDIANDEIDLESLIDNNYDGPLKPTIDAALQAKWSNILGPGYEIIVSTKHAEQYQYCKKSLFSVVFISVCRTG